MKACASFLGVVATVLGPLVAALGAVLMLGGCASCQSTVRHTSVPFLVGASLDGSDIDQGAHRLYIADSKSHGIDVFNISTATPSFVRTVDTGKSPAGLAVAPDVHRVYAGLDGGDVAAVDTDENSSTFMQVVNRLKVSQTSADLLDYSAAKHQLLVSTRMAGIVYAIDTQTNWISAAFAVNAPVEQPRFDSADGMVYVTAPTLDALVRIDPSTGTVARKFVAKGCRPAGLAINPDRQLAVVACRGGVAMFNLTTGAHDETRVFQGGDLVAYDAASDRFVVASPHEDRDSAVGVFSGDGEFIGSVAAPANAHAAAFDATHGLVYAAGPAGLMSIAPSACLPPPSWLKFLGSLSVFAVPLLAAAVFLLLYARHLSRRGPRAPHRPTYRDLQNEDLKMERERMQAFEDAVLGKQVNPELHSEP